MLIAEAPSGVRTWWEYRIPDSFRMIRAATVEEMDLIRAVENDPFPPIELTQRLTELMRRDGA